MALPPPLGPRLNSEPLNHPPGAPRELDTVGCPNCPVSGEERIRLPTPSSHEDPAGGKHYEHPISGREVLEADQDSLYLCLMGLGLWLQDLEQSLACWASAQSGMIQLQALQADLHGAAECVDALLAFGEGLAQWSEPQARASLEQVLRALGAHRDSIFWQLWRLQAQLVSYSLVFEEATTLDQDLEVEGDSDGPGPGGVWGPWTPSSLPTPAELEWDPAGDVGGFGPLGRKTAWTPGAPCELCGHRDPQGRGQGLEDMLMSGLSHRKHLVGHQRRSLLQKSQALLLQGGFLLSKKAAQQRHTHFLLVYPPQEEGATDLLEAVPELISTCPAWVYGLHPEPVTVAKLMECSDWHIWVTCPTMDVEDKRQTSPSLQDVSLEVDPGTPAPVSRWPLSFLLLLLLFLFLILVGATVLLPPLGGSCCCPTRQTRTPYLVLNYVNGPPPV